MKKIFSPTILLIGIILLAAFLRLWQLDSVPTGISDDELGFLINAKSFFFTGKDTTGNWLPFFLAAKDGSFPQAEIPYILLAPFVGFFDFSLAVSKLPYVFISITQVFLLFFITRKLIGKNEALIVALVASINPWSIFFGRTAYEAPLAAFFYLLALCILLIAKKWYILFAFIPLVLGFSSYMGTKLIFIPYALIICFYCWYVLNKKQFFKQYMTLVILCILFFFAFIYSIQFQSTEKRLSELATPNTPSISRTVDNERKLSMQTPLTKVFSNKVVVWGKESIDKYLRVFSPELLFLHGEGRSTFSLWYHGYFYYLDVVFLLIGFFTLFRKQRKEWSLLLALILIAPLPTVASTVGTGFAALRSVLLYPLFIIFIGLGIWYSIQTIKHSLYKQLFVGILLVLYLILLLNFANIYFFRNPIYNSEAYSLSSRILTRYIDLADKHNQQVVVVTNSSGNRFNHYLFENNVYKKELTSQIEESFKEKQFHIDNVTFVNCTEGLSLSLKSIYILDANMQCKAIRNAKFKTNLLISQLSDGAPIFKIFNTSVCKNHSLKPYPAPNNYSLSDFQIENLPEKQFCEKFIFDPQSKEL